MSEQNKTDNNIPDNTIPEDYQLFFQDGSFNDSIAPLYYTIEKSGPKFCLRVEKQHCNPMGICHGAVYMTLMDIAMGGTLCHAMGKYTGTPTVSMTLDYMASSVEGELLFIEAEPLKLTKSMGFSQGLVKNADGEIKMRASGVFKLPRDLENAPGVTVEEFEKLAQTGKEHSVDYKF